MLYYNKYFICSVLYLYLQIISNKIYNFEKNSFEKPW